MAKLKIYNQIVDEETAVMFREFYGTDGICYKDITEFIEGLDEADPDIELLIHCPGGDCLEGWTIYDKLRHSGKQISATIEGECSSMATILLLSAPAERRFAFENARMCIHNPAFLFPDDLTAERLTASELGKLKNKLAAQEAALIEEQNKILDLYVERTGADRGELQAIMDEDKFINMDKAKELGFITGTIAPNTAKKNHKLFNNKKMAKEEKITIASNVMKRLLALAGIAKIEDVNVPLDQKVTSADGTEFTVEREDGDPQVGDKAYPNGTYTLEDGTVIVVEDEVIASITPAGEPEPKTEPESEPTTEPSNEEALKAQVENLTAANEALKAENETLKSENETLKAEKETLSQAQKTEEDVAILDVVAKAGGKAWLDTVCNMASTFNAANRQFVPHGENNKDNSKLTKTQELLAKKKAEQEAKRKK